MKLTNLVNAGMILLLLLAGGSFAAWADSDRSSDKHRYEDKKHKGEQHSEKQKHHDKSAYKNHERRHDKSHSKAKKRRHDKSHHRAERRHKKGYVLDQRHDHNHYYPPRGYKTRKLSHNHHVSHYRGTRYYFDAGIWYRPSGWGYASVMPPSGLFVQVLPPYYTTLWVGSIPYYYSAGVYYNYRPYRDGYVVVDAPPDTELSEQSPVMDKLFIYPKKGQSEEQQARDRYECHSWSTDQTGFDPSRPGGNVAKEQYSSKYNDYNRAMKACLEARGYSVQ